MPERITQVVLPYWWTGPVEEVVEVGLAAEQLGYQEVWIGELTHFDAFALAGYLAARTEEITLCVGPLALGVRDPLSLARGIASISWLGGREARLALGASNPTVVSRFHGRPWEPPAAVAGDTIAVIRQILAGERTDHHGDRWSSSGYRSALAPQPLHLTVAAFGPQMTRVAVHADRMVLNLVTVDQAVGMVDRVRAMARAVGGASPPVATWLVAALDPDDRARKQVTWQLASYLAAPGYGEMFTEAGYGELVAEARQGAGLAVLSDRIPDDLIQAVCAFGDKEEIWRRIDAYRAAGVEPAIVPVTAGDPGGRRILGALSG